MLGVALRADRDELADRHRHRPGDERGDTGGEHRRPRRVGGGDADDQAGGGDDSVVGPEHGRAQPADALRAVVLRVGHPASRTRARTGNRRAHRS